MPSLADEMNYWAEKAADVHHNMLATVQSSAGKWQASIAAFLGLYGTVGFVLGPSQLTALPVHGQVQVVVLAAYGLAGAFGLAALWQSNLAAQGIPEILNGTPITGQLLSRLSTERAVSADRQLKRAIACAAVAGLLAIGISVSLVVAGALASRNPKAVVVGPAGAYCGQLRNSGGQLSLVLPDGKVIPIAGSSLSQVASCP